VEEERLLLLECGVWVVDGLVLFGASRPEGGEQVDNDDDDDGWW